MGIDNGTNQKDIKKHAQSKINELKIALKTKDYNYFSLNKMVPNNELQKLAKQKVREIKAAYTVLGNPESRKKYDNNLPEIKRDSRKEVKRKIHRKKVKIKIYTP